MKTFKGRFLGFLTFGLIVFSCNKDTIKTYDVSGVAQKGPFITGTVITISELDENLIQTGKVFTSIILDDLGNFEIPEVEFASSFVQLSADGCYYNELHNGIDPARLVLTSIADLNESGTVNINILSHIETERLKYLIKEKNLSFTEAKLQSYKEILNIFEIDPSSSVSSEKLDLSKTGLENIELLAVSSILQNSRNIPGLTELLTRVQIDLKEDGILDSETLQSELITSAVLLDCDRIAKNLKARYSFLGLDIPIPDIRPVIDSFTEKSGFHKLINIDIPQSTEPGLNILALGDTVQIDVNQTYCIAVNQEISTINGCFTGVSFKDIESVPSRENVETDNIQNWLLPSPHTFGSNEQISYYLENFTGNANMKVAFRNHGQFNLTLSIESQDYGFLEKTQFLKW